MRPDHEADDLHALLHEEYGAPRLDDEFSAGLIARLQAEASSLPSLTPARPRRSLLAICLAIATVAALVFAVIWISNPGTPGTNHEAARRDKTDSNRLTLLDLSTQIEESEKDDRVDHLSVSPRSMSLSPESESLSALSASLSARSESESKNYSESLAQRKASLVADESQATKLSQTTTLSVLSSLHKEWPNISATAALADKLYVVDSGHLYEVSPIDRSRRSVGDDDWQNTAAMGAANGHLYIVSDNQLYEVNRATGARRSLGKPEWANTKAILTVGDKLYIASNGLLYRVNPSDGSHEVLHSKNDSPNNPRQPKP